MKKKATHKDFYMEIQKSAGRFLSILFIVALGVAFFFRYPFLRTVYAYYGRRVF